MPSKGDSMTCVRACALVLFTCAGGALAGAVDTTVQCMGMDVARVVFGDPTLYSSGATGGITVNGSAAPLAGKLADGCELRWVQTIRTSHPLNTNTPPNMPYFDPGELDMTGDNDPFYWNSNLVANDGNEHPGFWYKNKQFNSIYGTTGISFFDEPKRTWSGAAINWQAELVLVLNSGMDSDANGKKEFAVLWAGNYGFSITAGGLLTINGIAELAAPVDLTNAFLMSKFSGWEIGDCEGCIVPAPATAAVLVGVLAVRRRRRR